MAFEDREIQAINDLWQGDLLDQAPEFLAIALRENSGVLVDLVIGEPRTELIEFIDFLEPEIGGSTDPLILRKLFRRLRNKLVVLSEPLSDLLTTKTRHETIKIQKGNIANQVRAIQIFFLWCHLANDLKFDNASKTWQRKERSIGTEEQDENGIADKSAVWLLKQAEAGKTLLDLIGVDAENNIRVYEAWISGVNKVVDDWVACATNNETAVQTAVGLQQCGAGGGSTIEALSEGVDAIQKQKWQSIREEFKSSYKKLFLLVNAITLSDAASENEHDKLGEYRRELLRRADKLTQPSAPAHEGP